MTGIMRMWTIWIAGSALLLSSLACSVGGDAPTKPASPIPVTTEAAGQLEVVWATAIASSKSGQVSVTITEQQLTSYVALKLAADPSSPLKEPQIFLRDGEMIIYGTVTVSGVSAPTEIALSAAPNADGLLEIQIEKAGFGPLPLPASVRDSLSDSLNELLAGALGPKGTGMTITAVTIADGNMVVAATVPQ